MSRVHGKTIEEVLDYGWNYTKELAKTGDTLTGSVWEIDAGLTVVSQGNDAQVASLFVSGGGPVGTRYRAHNRVATAGGRTYARTFYIQIVTEKST
ncbi:MAG: hypothetical protein M3H12_18805 [Chromatiales bacterium]|nr:hypothetical protein [Gammaproteobacteria bacterium]